METRGHRLAAIGIVCLLMQPAPVSAQTFPRGSGWGATMVIEPIIIAHGGFSAPCNARAASRARWGVDQIEEAVSPTGPQRAALDELRAAVAKAADLSAGACPTPIPRRSNERLVFLEKRLAALREAVRLVVPAFEAFYAALNDQQKARLDAGPRRWRWRWPGS